MSHTDLPLCEIVLCIRLNLNKILAPLYLTYNTKHAPIPNTCFFVSFWGGRVNHGNHDGVMPICPKHLPNDHHHFSRNQGLYNSQLDWNAVCSSLYSQQLVNADFQSKYNGWHSLWISFCCGSHRLLEDMQECLRSGSIVLQKGILHQNHSPSIFHARWNCSFLWIASYHRWQPVLALHCTCINHAVRNDYIWINHLWIFQLHKVCMLIWIWTFMLTIIIGNWLSFG